MDDRVGPYVAMKMNYGKDKCADDLQHVFSSWFILEGGLSLDAAESVPRISRRLCAEIGPQALALCDAFDISDTMLSAPVALDWVGYNSYDNQGELEDPPAL